MFLVQENALYKTHPNHHISKIDLGKNKTQFILYKSSKNSNNSSSFVENDTKNIQVRELYKISTNTVHEKGQRLTKIWTRRKGNFSQFQC